MDKLTSYIELDIPLPESLPSPMIEEIIQLVLSDICTTIPKYTYSIVNNTCKIQYTHIREEEE